MRSIPTENYNRAKYFVLLQIESVVDYCRVTKEVELEDSEYHYLSTALKSTPDYYALRKIQESLPKLEHKRQLVTHFCDILSMGSRQDIRLAFFMMMLIDKTNPLCDFSRKLLFHKVLTIKSFLFEYPELFNYVINKDDLSELLEAFRLAIISKKSLAFGMLIEITRSTK